MAADVPTSDEVFYGEEDDGDSNLDEELLDEAME